MFIKGVGMTKFDYSQKEWWKLAYEATMEALEDARMRISQIDCIVFTGMESCDGFFEHQTHKASFLADLFKTHIPIITVPAVCAGGGVAFWTALRLKEFKNILVVSGEKLVDNVTPVTTHWISSAIERVIEQTQGLNFPLQNALVWEQYKRKYGATHEDLELISFKNHQNAALNEKACFYKKPVSLEQIKNAPKIAGDFTMYDCALSVNGGAAVILTQEKTDIQVIGSGLATDYLLTFSRKDITHFLATKLAAKRAYEQAKVKPEDIQVIEIHDAFTSIELISYEDLGFAPEGKGAELIRKGIVNIDGKFPVNTSGGLKAKGHPISPTGLSQIYQIVKQLRGQAKDVQVKPIPTLGLAHNIGGAGGSVTVHIFRKV